MDRLMKALLEEGCVLFNRRLFFEAHEVWEEAWRRARGEDEVLLHGLIQVAAGFHKLHTGQPSGASSLLTKGAAKLATLTTRAGVLDLETFRASVETRRAELAGIAARGTVDEPSSMPRLPEPQHRLFERRLITHLEIDATAERVWDILTDAGSYPRWNPFIVSLAGEPRGAGARLTVTIRPSGGRAMTFRPVVLVADPGRELRWLGRLFVSGLFDGEHVFGIAPLTPGRVRFSQRETFRGLLVPLMPPSMWSATQRGFEQMNEALKRRAESGPETVRRITD